MCAGGRNNIRLNAYQYIEAVMTPTGALEASVTTEGSVVLGAFLTRSLVGIGAVCEE